MSLPRPSAPVFPAPVQRRLTHGYHAMALALLACGALALRLWGITFGLPLVSNYYVRPDETLVVISAVELFARHGNPGHVDYPAAMMVVLAVAYRGLHGLLAVLGLASPAFLDDAAGNLSRYFLAGRVFSALVGATTALVVYRVAVRFASPTAAGVAATWYAVSPLAVREAHYAVTDTFMALLVGCAVVSAIRVLEAPTPLRRRAILVCAVATGAAVATKYPAGAVVPGLAVAFLLPSDGSRLSIHELLRWLVVVVATFAVLNPWLVTHPAFVLAWFSRIVSAVYGARNDLVVAALALHGWPGLRDYAGLMPGGILGTVCAVTGISMGAGVAWRNGNPRILPPLLVTLSFVLLLAPVFTLPFRYLVPLLPLSAMWTAVTLHLTAREWLPRRGGLVVSVLIGAIGFVSTAPATWYLVRSLATEDTRTEAGRWIHAHVPPSVPIVWLGMPESEPQVPETADSLRRRITYVENTYGASAARVIERPYLLAMRTPPPEGYMVIRNPRPSSAAPRLVCVVQASYPSPTVVTDREMLDAWTRGRTLLAAHIGRPLPPGPQLLEPWDAFFLPLYPDRVIQPGPQFDLYLVERE